MEIREMQVKAKDQKLFVSKVALTTAAKQYSPSISLDFKFLQEWKMLQGKRHVFELLGRDFVGSHYNY